MQKTLLQKTALIGLVLLILQGLLLMIGGVVDERHARRDAVTREIASSHFGSQAFAGPVLSIPYVEEYEEAIPSTGQPAVARQRIERTLRLFPARSEILGAAAAGTKSRGLFKARIFDWQAGISGEFDIAAPAFERSRERSTITWGRPTLSFALGDPRGLIGTPTLRWGEETLAFEKGSGLPNIGNGLHASPARIDPARAQRIAYTMKIGLRGTDSLSVVPLAHANRVVLESAWPHPSFGGEFLPDPQTQQVTKDGFAAAWQVDALASKAQQQILAQISRNPPCHDTICADRMAVRFIEPIDIYALSDRAIKYGLLFIILTFACFMLFEIVKRLPLHPAQYFLVGLALAVFFLLLIALSEHLAFARAYLAAAGACIALIGVYLCAVLRSALRGIGFACLLAALYGALYGLLIAEDIALLLGSLLIFGLIALAMMVTRKVDWYASEPGTA